MRVTIALLVVYVLALVIEVPIGLQMLINQNGAASAIGPASPQLPGSLGGAIEAIFCLLALQHQFVPANINFRNPDEDVDLNIAAMAFSPVAPEERRIWASAVDQQPLIRPSAARTKRCQRRSGALISENTAP